MKGNELSCFGEQAAFKVVEQKSCKGIVRCCTQPSAQSCPVDMGFAENLPSVHVPALVLLPPAAPWQGCGSSSGKALSACSFAPGHPSVCAGNVTRLVTEAVSLQST